MRNIFRGLLIRMVVVATDESGMSTVEYSTVKVYNRVLLTEGTGIFTKGAGGGRDAPEP